jgi:hypothetical protein
MTSFAPLVRSLATLQVYDFHWYQGTGFQLAREVNKLRSATALDRPGPLNGTPFPLVASEIGVTFKIEWDLTLDNLDTPSRAILLASQLLTLQALSVPSLVYRFSTAAYDIKERVRAFKNGLVWGECAGARARAAVCMCAVFHHCST